MWPGASRPPTSPAQIGDSMDKFTLFGPQEIPRLVPLAEEFYNQGFLPGTFDPQEFIRHWQQFTSGGPGIVIAAEDFGEVVGAIGGLVGPDINTGDRVLFEQFWFVTRDHRKGSLGDELLGRFENEARSLGCHRVNMVHLADEIGAKLGAVYRRRGFIPSEMHYIKTLD